MNIRDATAAHVDVIAQLHVDSWRSAYATILSASYLAGPIEADRQSVWQERFTSPAANLKVLIAEDKGQPIGFVCIFGNSDKRWGTLVDNLHVSPKAKGRGIGKYLLRTAAHWSVQHHPGVGLHLWVYEVNAAARAFYERMGGQIIARQPQSSPDGNIHVELCYFWSNPTHSLAELRGC
ncbi:GNAT family N-acetyltransferase [Sinorhizobium medicae]|uniref:GNAT family N-acetyltransferase n=1 Tax=Sinorhizobium medicae TaxID=110321 RepID=UPI00129776E1|nr:GNAT family N-acetyltransferase [Sinorhizobium medicae]MDX0967914.1 GNAT family N-acetyltransferase [Sinorhizobium medicae]MQV49895.1 GNAT family N-acetyltransferase [Sinorhizobium medicae]MQV51231.1 GNAT family N-acetyltransferase [Sinorhizobium medicae]MQV75323.1 GNAT family N-acetyltransferase [Sinorhizobium medicae]WQO88526.1 GNAT family N-acetyltransferase [Sinorhizobium medicae]